MLYCVKGLAGCVEESGNERFASQAVAVGDLEVFGIQLERLGDLANHLKRLAVEQGWLVLPLQDARRAGPSRSMCRTLNKLGTLDPLP